MDARRALDRDTDGDLLREALGATPPEAPIDDLWSGVRARLPAPRGRLLSLTGRALTIAAAAAILLLAILLLAPTEDATESRLRLRVVDVTQPEETRELSREEAASIFYGSEAPVLLGADDADPTGGGG